VPVDSTGGHIHRGGRLKGTLSISSLTIPGGVTAGSVSAGTYTSSEVAGQENVIATVKGGTSIQVPITVRVPGLLELGEGDGYALIGTTSEHPLNHFGTENTLYTLLDLADAYFETWNGTLRINDISLALGGLFDIDADWSIPHKSHRVGKNADISNITAEGSSVTRNSLIKVIGDFGLDISVLDEGNHFHLTFP
jgi:hypothetical protein